MILLSYAISLTTAQNYRLLQITEQDFHKQKLPTFCLLVSCVHTALDDGYEERWDHSSSWERGHSWWFLGSFDGSFLGVLASKSILFILLSLHFTDDADTLTVRFTSGSPTPSHPHFTEKEHPHISEKIVHGIWTLEIETDAHATTCSMNYF